MPFWSVVLAAVVAFGLQVIPDLDSGTAGQSGASIKGAVIDGATKAPTTRCARPVDWLVSTRPVLTDDAGAFVFSRAPRRNLLFVIERNGYLSVSWPIPPVDPAVRRSQIRLAATDHVENVTLAIEPAA